LAAGLVLLGASSAPAAESAANYSTSINSVEPAGALRAVGGDGALRPMPSSDLKALEWAAGFTPVQPAQVVHLPAATGAADWNAGDPLTCMAQAIYFEARSESQVGQEAVAQVVMNRTRLPQYPSTVCGVVFQGGDRATGCQFTFVCDGSLRAPTDMEAWGRAIDIARKALAGYVCKPVIDATHYHAAWMTPYWAASLTRIRQLGGQIFYH
jgi:spore germination cell wall hydrolase CwlJ-like protein